MASYSAKAATCTEYGWNAYKACDREDCEYTTYKEIAALGHTYYRGTCTRTGCGSKEPTHTHEWNSGAITTQATCTKMGVKTYSCWCNATYTESIAMLGHDVVEHAGKAATCTAIGWDAYETCTRCSYTTYKEIAKNNNHDVEYHAGKEATCITIGWNAYETCNRTGCKYSTYVEIAKNNNHDIEYHAGQAANCSQVGWDAYETCSRCSYTTYKELAKNDNHDLVYHEGQAATCTEIGWNAYNTCSRCSYNTKEEIPAAGHKYNEAVVRTATCEDIGVKTFTCLCGDSYDEEIAVLGHNKVQYSAQAPGCETIGWNPYEACTRCSYTTYEEIPAKGHKFGVGIITTAATCTTAGVMTFTCSCGDMYTLPVEVLGHDYGEWTVYKAATCTASGESRRVCKNNSAHYETKIIEATGHTFGEWKLTKTPTCAVAGERARTCQICSVNNTEPVVVTNVHSIDDNGICRVCKNSLKTKLNAPRISKTDERNVFWTKVTDAEKYEIRVDGSTISDIESVEYNLENFFYGKRH